MEEEEAHGAQASDVRLLFEAMLAPAFLARRRGGSLILEALNARASERAPHLRAFVGRDLYDVYVQTPEFRAELERSLDEHRVGSILGRVHRRDRNGAYQLARTNIVPLSDEYVVVTWADQSSDEELLSSLRECDAWLRAVLGALGESVVVQRADGYVVSCNAAAGSTFELTPSEAIAKGAFLAEGYEFLDEAGRSHAPWGRESIERGLAGELHDVVLTLRTPRGAVRKLLANVAPVVIDHGTREPAYVTTFADITARLASERDLVRSEERYRQLFENTPHGIWCFGLDGRSLFANRTMAELLGTTLEDLRSAPPEDFVDERTMERTHGSLAASMQDPESRRRWVEEQLVASIRSEKGMHELEFRRRDGEHVFLRVTGTPYREDGIEVGVFVTAVDVTATRRAEETMRASRRRLEMALEAGEMVAWEWDRTESTGQWSLDFERMFGEDASRGLAGLLGRVHPEDFDRAAEAIRELMTGPLGGRATIEFRALASDGEYRWLRSIGRIYADDNETRLVGVTRDISEQKHVTEAAAANMRLESIGRLAGGVAHDFNNLLMAIRSATRLLEERIPESCHEDLHVIGHAADRAAELTRQLLSFARMQPVESKPENANEVMLDVVNLLRRVVGHRVEVEFRAPERPNVVRVDRGRLEQVLLNLGLNARDAMPDGGRITLAIGLRRIDAPSPATADLPAGDYVVLSVTDEGVGIPEDVLPRIFEPFFTTKRAGTGLGLASAHGLVKQFGGDITVRSDERGSTFEVYLPESVEPAPAAPPPETATPTSHGTILLVEDHDLVRRTTERFLRRLGYFAWVTSDATEALAIAARPDVQIDILMTDVVMEGMNGPALAAQFAELRPDAGILFVSGYSPSGLIAQQGSYFLQKPYSIDALEEKLRTILERVQADRGARRPPT